MNRVCLFGWVALASCLVTAGCRKDPGTPTLLEARPQPFVQDVPVPRKFDLDSRKSDHQIIAGRRQVKHLYRGSASTLAVRNFYAHNMPIGQWNMVDESLNEGVYVLHFKKNEEKCEIRIEKVPAGMFSPSTLVTATLKSIYPADAP